MARLFTHHDRLYLYNNDQAPHDHASGDMEDNQEMGDTKTASPSKPDKPAGGFALYIPHFHKVFGLLSLLNMLLYLTPLHARIVDAIGTARLVRFSLVHVILAWTSFEFRIGRARNGLYTIYREMQLHTIIFTMRSWCALMCAYHFNITNIVTRSAIVLFWHVMADLATHFYRPPSGETTIRRAVNGKKGYQEHGRLAHVGLWFFSFSQLVGTYMLLTDSADVARDAMFIMTPVQVSAFLATLVRKGYTSSRTSVTIYFMILLPIMFYHHWTVLDMACVAAAQVLRFQLRLNKYIMWLGIMFTVAYLRGDLQQLLYQYAPQLAFQLPHAPELPVWIDTDTYQPGSLIGDAFQKLFA